MAFKGIFFLSHFIASSDNVDDGIHVLVGVARG
jgi:hypothetical protein